MSIRSTFTTAPGRRALKNAARKRGLELDGPIAPTGDEQEVHTLIRALWDITGDGRDAEDFTIGEHQNSPAGGQVMIALTYVDAIAATFAKSANTIAELGAIRNEMAEAVEVGNPPLAELARYALSLFVSGGGRGRAEVKSYLDAFRDLATVVDNDLLQPELAAGVRRHGAKVAMAVLVGATGQSGDDQ